MNVLEFTVLVGLGSLAAGFLGSLTGLGGGMVLVPFLTLGLGVDLRYAAGASLVSVIPTSSGAAAYVREGYSNIRVGMFLEIATTWGAVAGALAAALISTQAIAVVFGLVLLVLLATPVARVGFSAFAFLRQHDWLYVLVTLIVLAVLAYSLFSGSIHDRATILPPRDDRAGFRPTVANIASWSYGNRPGLTGGADRSQSQAGRRSPSYPGKR
jgi:uncharacterized membrane protein YfcA